MFWARVRTRPSRQVPGSNLGHVVQVFDYAESVASGLGFPCYIRDALGRVVGHTGRMSHQDTLLDMVAWSSGRLRRWMVTLSEDDAPQSVNWWLRARSIAQQHAYDRALTSDLRREWTEVALSLTGTRLGAGPPDMGPGSAEPERPGGDDPDAG